MANYCSSSYELTREGDGDIQIPIGHRFVPSHHQFIHDYLRNKILDSPMPCNLIEEIPLSQEQDPELLPINKYQYFRNNEIYFFTQTSGRNSEKSRRILTTQSGYWQTTDEEDGDVPIFEDDKIIGYKKTYIYYSGSVSNGEKTRWTMKEYRVNAEIIPAETLNDNVRTKIEHYVGCRIRYKEPKQEPVVEAGEEKNEEIEIIM